MKTALNEEIVLGKVYGWSQNVSGLTHSTIGKVVKILEKSVTLRIISHSVSLYGGEFVEREVSPNTVVNIRTPILFPVSGWDWWHELTVGDTVRPSQSALTLLPNPLKDTEYIITNVDYELITVDGLPERFHYTWFTKVNKT
jgi:hypothetical protein